MKTKLGFKTMVVEKEVFSGKENGISWERFEEKVISWGRKRFGDKYAKALWKDELMDIEPLDLNTEGHRFDFDLHCHLVNDVLSLESPKYADTLYYSERY